MKPLRLYSSADDDVGRGILSSATRTRFHAFVARHEPAVRHVVEQGTPGVQLRPLRKTQPAQLVTEAEKATYAKLKALGGPMTTTRIAEALGCGDTAAKYWQRKFAVKGHLVMVGRSYRFVG